MTKTETRSRIVKATRALHEEVGPAATTITAIAARAGVQRLTVYRHFPDDRALIGACSDDWRADHPLPDPGSWSGLEGARERMKKALGSLYAYYRGGSAMLERILRDEEGVPELKEVMTPWWEYHRELAAGLSVGWGGGARRQRLIRVAVGHAARFATWRSLAAEGLEDPDIVALMVCWVVGLASEEAME